MEIKEANKYGTLAPDRLAEFERALGIRLPEEYRSFLCKYNGGEPFPDSFNIPDGDVSGICQLYGLHEGPETERLDATWLNYQGRIPDHLLAIGCDPGGNEICIGLRGNERGRIYFWDHETEEVQEIAGSFTEFLEGLFEWVDPNEHAFARICRTNDLAEVERFIASTLDLDTTDNYGRTLLENAAIWNRPEIVRRLYQAGASLRQARDYAERNEHTDLVALLDSLTGRAD